MGKSTINKQKRNIKHTKRKRKRKEKKKETRRKEEKHACLVGCYVGS
jgi:hypothetical protein